MRILYRLSLFVALLTWAAIAAEPTTQRPNFVVFIADDHTAIDSEPYGSTEVRTPQMAKLAAEGMRFTQAFVASPACGPSRTALLTGLWSARNGAEPNHKPKNPGVASLPPVLKALGYETAAIGKVAHNTYAAGHGFDHIEGPNPGFADTQAVARFLATRDRTKPLCLFVGTRHPHTVWSADPAYDPAKVSLPPAHVDTPVTRREWTRYLTDVTKADTLLGEVRALARQHLSADTVFVYTADHGAAWPFSKWTLYDAGIRTPLLVAWPSRIRPGTTSDALVCWPDLLPTFIELAGGRVPADIDGRSFVGVLRGTTTGHRDRIFATHSGDGNFNVFPIRAVRTRGWKYIRNLRPEFQQHSHISRSTGPSGLVYWKTWLAAAEHDPAAAATVKRYIEHPAEELYDLTADPHELRNLAADPNHAARLAGLRSDLDAWMKQQGDTQTVFGQPLLRGEPVTLITPGGPGKKK